MSNDKVPRKSNERILRDVIAWPLMIFALLITIYVFSFPARLVNGNLEPSRFNFICAILSYVFMWVCNIFYLFIATAKLYGSKKYNLYKYRDPITKSITGEDGVREFEKRYTPFIAIEFTLISFALTIYSFAISYVYLSSIKPESFNIGKLDLFSGIYFSLTTITTVGYGDIVPLTKLARSIVMLEITGGILYGIFIFSALASFIVSNITKRQ